MCYGPQVHIFQCHYAPSPTRTCPAFSRAQPHPSLSPTPRPSPCSPKPHSQRREPNDKRPAFHQPPPTSPPPPTATTKNHDPRSYTPFPITFTLGHAHLTLPLPPAVHLSHHVHSTDTRGRGSSSGVHCDVAKGHEACKRISRVRLLVWRPLGTMTTGVRLYV